MISRSPHRYAQVRHVRPDGPAPSPSGQTHFKFTGKCAYTHDRIHGTTDAMVRRPVSFKRYPSAC